MIDWNGLPISSSGLDDDSVSVLSALSADMISVERRHADRLQNAFGLSNQGWAAVDTFGSSRLGAWPLYVGEHRFMLVVLGEPQFRRDEFVELVWTLISRHG